MPEIIRTSRQSRPASNSTQSDCCLNTVPLEILEMYERRVVILLSYFSPPMLISLTTFFTILSSIFRSRAALQLENLALRHQIGVLQRFCEKTSKIDPRGPTVVGLAVSPLARLALGTGHRQARNGPPGIVPAFACSGPGRRGAANPDDRSFPARSEI